MEVFELHYHSREETLAILLVFFPRDVSLMILDYALSIPFCDYDGYPLNPFPFAPTLVKPLIEIAPNINVIDVDFEAAEGT